jgi:DNA-binding transcriptional regulator YhcF (GntR family)
MRMDIRDRTKASKAYGILKALITMHDLKVGIHLEVEELAKLLQCSVTPVRESLTRLASELLVEIHPNRGYFVRKPDLIEQLSVHEFGNLLLVQSTRSLKSFDIGTCPPVIHGASYCDFLMTVVDRMNNDEISRTFRNLTDRSIGLVRVHLEDDVNRSLAARDIANFFQAKSAAEAENHLFSLRDRFSGALPFLVREAILRKSNGMSGLSVISAIRDIAPMSAVVSSD